MKIRFDIKAGVRGGGGAVIPTGVILSGLILSLGIEPSTKTVGGTLILCGVSFILGMVWFGIKTVSEKDENPGD